MLEFELGQHREHAHQRVVHGRFSLIQRNSLKHTWYRRVIDQVRDIPWQKFLQEVGYNKFGYSIMSSKVISPSFKLIGVEGSIAISV